MYVNYNKYKNKKIVIDNKKFDSTKEANYYITLVKKKNNGEIQDFELQPKFELQPAFINNKGKKIRSITYKADFLVTHNDNSQEVVDVKGYPTSEFKIKKKMFEYKYPNYKLTII